jgi:hypothetical protein
MAPDEGDLGSETHESPSKSSGSWIKELMDIPILEVAHLSCRALRPYPETTPYLHYRASQLTHGLHKDQVLIDQLDDRCSHQINKRRYATFKKNPSRRQARRTVHAEKTSEVVSTLSHLKTNVE